MENPDVWLDSSEVSCEGDRTLKMEHCLTVLSNRQPESDGTTTSALLWLNLRNVCTFSAVTLHCFLVQFTCLPLFILFGFFFCYGSCYLKVWPEEEAGNGDWVAALDRQWNPALWPSTPGSHVMPVTALSFMLYKNTHIYLCICNLNLLVSVHADNKKLYSRSSCM